jgi:hypothetical protein
MALLADSAGWLCWLALLADFLAESLGLLGLAASLGLLGLAASLGLLGLAEKLSRSGGQKAFHPE